MDLPRVRDRYGQDHNARVKDSKTQVVEDAPARGDEAVTEGEMAEQERCKVSHPLAVRRRETMPRP